MSQKLVNEVTDLKIRVEAIEQAMQILFRSHVDLETSPVIDKLRNDIQGIKMRMGKKETV